MQHLQQLRRWIKINSKFLREIGTLSSGVLIAQIIFLIATPILSRLYDPAAFGYFGVAINAMSILALFATFRAEVLIPLVARKRDAQTILFVIFIWSGTFCAVAAISLLIWGENLSTKFATIKQYEHVFAFIPLLTFLLAVYSALRLYRIRNEDYVPVAIGQVIRSLANVISTIGYAFVPGLPGAGQGLIIGQIAGDASFGLSMFKIGWHDARRIVSTNWEMIKRLVVRCGHLLKTMFFTQCMATVYQRVPILIIAVAFGPVQAGFFALAEKIIAAPTALVSAPIGEVYRQTAVAAFKRSGQFHEELKRTIKLGAGLSTLPFLAAILLIPYFIGPVFGENWVDASDVFIILLIGSYVSFIVQPLDKGGWIVGATGYIVTYHTFRFIFEIAAGLTALFGYFSFLEFLIAMTAVRVLALFYMLMKEWSFSLGHYERQSN